jgi:hypothetical protein
LTKNARLSWRNSRRMPSRSARSVVPTQQAPCSWYETDLRTHTEKQTRIVSVTPGRFQRFEWNRSRGRLPKMNQDVGGLFSLNGAPERSAKGRSGNEARTPRHTGPRSNFASGGALRRRLKLTFEPPRHTFGFHRIGPVAIKTLELALSLPIERQHKNQGCPAV